MFQEEEQYKRWLSFSVNKLIPDLWQPFRNFVKRAKKKKRVKFMLAVTIMGAFYFYRKTGFSSRKRINLKGPFHWKFDEIHSLFGGN